MEEDSRVVHDHRYEMSEAGAYAEEKMQTGGGRRHKQSRVLACGEASLITISNRNLCFKRLHTYMRKLLNHVHAFGPCHYLSKLMFLLSTCNFPELLLRHTSHKSF